MKDNKYYCWNCNKVEILEPQYCCDGKECGCMRLPIEPPFCSETCEKEYLEKLKKCFENTKTKGKPTHNKIIQKIIHIAMKELDTSKYLKLNNEEIQEGIIKHIHKEYPEYDIKTIKKAVEKAFKLYFNL